VLTVAYPGASGRPPLPPSGVARAHHRRARRAAAAPRECQRVPVPPGAGTLGAARQKAAVRPAGAAAPRRAVGVPAKAKPPGPGAAPAPPVYRGKAVLSLIARAPRTVGSPAPRSAARSPPPRLPARAATSPRGRRLPAAARAGTARLPAVPAPHLPQGPSRGRRDPLAAGA